MTITSPTGRQYQWSSDAPPTQADYDALAKYDAEQSGVKYDPAAGKTPAPYHAPSTFYGTTIPESETANRIAGAVADVGLEAGGATAGQAVGTALAPATFGASIPVGGFIGGAGGNALGQYRRMKAGEADKFSLGQMLGAGVAGAIPGVSQTKAGVGVGTRLATEGLKMAGTNLAAKAVETGVDEGRLPTLDEGEMAAGSAMLGVAGAKAVDTGSRNAAALVAKIKNRVRDQTLAEARVLGYAVQPSLVNPNMINQRLESLAGKAALTQEIGANNQEITSEVASSWAKKALGQPGEAPITEEVLDQIRAKAAKPYQEIAAFSEKAQSDLVALDRAKLNTSDPHEYNILMSDPEIIKERNPLIIKAAADINGLREARGAAAKNFSAYQAGGGRDPGLLDAARASSALAEKLEQQIEDAANEIGRPGLVKELREARTTIAQSHEIERALNLGDASISAPILGRRLDRGVPLTGDLATIAKFQQSRLGRNVMKDGAVIPSAGVSKLSAMASIGVGLGGMAATGSPYGLAAAAVPLADSPIRKLLASRPYQRLAASPIYPGVGQQDTLASYIRLGSQAAGRKKWWEQ